ncbi:MAG: hypothetical protein ACLUUO_14505 [Sellimonas intestinalis]
MKRLESKIYLKPENNATYRRTYIEFRIAYYKISYPTEEEKGKGLMHRIRGESAHGSVAYARQKLITDARRDDCTC